MCLPEFLIERHQQCPIAEVETARQLQSVEQGEFTRLKFFGLPLHQVPMQQSCGASAIFL